MLYITKRYKEIEVDRKEIEKNIGEYTIIDRNKENEIERDSREFDFLQTRGSLNYNERRV